MSSRSSILRLALVLALVCAVPLSAQVVSGGGGGAVTCATCATSANQSAILAAIQAPWPAGTNLGGNVGIVYPAGSIPINASTTGTTLATTATLAANASLHTNICGLSIRGNATAAATGNATVTGLATATLNFTHWTAPLASGVGLTEMIFSPCLQSSTVNTAIAVNAPAAGSGGVESVTAWGYQGPN